jgi:hypothetical protein
MKTCLAIVTALSALISAGTALAATPSYNGNWPITISGARYYDGNYCLVLNGGGAELTGPLGDLYGNFQVFGRTLIAIVPLENGGCGCNSGEVFVLGAKNGELTKGTYVEDGDGEIDNSGTAKVGKENGC